MIVLQHSLVRKFLHCHVIIMIMFNAKVVIFPLSYAVIPSVISCFITYHIDPYFILNIFIAYSYVHTCDCSIGVTAVLEYLKSAFHLQGRGERYCHFSITINTKATIHDTE